MIVGEGVVGGWEKSVVCVGPCVIVGARGERTWSETGPACSHVRVHACSDRGVRTRRQLGLADRQLSATGHFLLC